MAKACSTPSLILLSKKWTKALRHSEALEFQHQFGLINLSLPHAPGSDACILPSHQNALGGLVSSSLQLKYYSCLIPNSSPASNPHNPRCIKIPSRTFTFYFKTFHHLPCYTTLLPHVCILFSSPGPGVLRQAGPICHLWLLPTFWYSEHDCWSAVCVHVEVPAWVRTWLTCNLFFSALRPFLHRCFCYQGQQEVPSFLLPGRGGPTVIGRWTSLPNVQ